MSTVANRKDKKFIYSLFVSSSFLIYMYLVAAKMFFFCFAILYFYCTVGKEEAACIRLLIKCQTLLFSDQMSNVYNMLKIKQFSLTSGCPQDT